MNYFFIYNKTTGNLTEQQANESEGWSNIPEGCGVIGPIHHEDEQAKEAFEHPNYYTVGNKNLTPVANINDLRAADQVPKPAPVSPLDEVKQQIADINLVLADMMGA